MLFIGGTDFTLRALDLATGEVLWSHEMKGAVSGGPAIIGDDVFAVAGIREPGPRRAHRDQRRVPLLASATGDEADDHIDDGARPTATP